MLCVVITWQRMEGKKLIPKSDSNPNTNPDSNPDEKDLKSNKTIDLSDECGEPEPGCFSSTAEFRYRVWDFFTRWKYIILPCC